MLRVDDTPCVNPVLLETLLYARNILVLSLSPSVLLFYAFQYILSSVSLSLFICVWRGGGLPPQLATHHTQMTCTPRVCVLDRM